MKHLWIFGTFLDYAPFQSFQAGFTVSINAWTVVAQVTTYDGVRNVPVTSNYVQMSNGCIQGSYVDMPVRRNATKVFVELNQAHSGSVSGLSELEIYIEGKEVWDR